MPITIHWDDAAQTTLRWDMVDHWTWQDFWNAVEETNRLAQGRAQRIDLLADISRSAPIPDGALSVFRRVDTMGGPDGEDTGLVVLTGGDRFMQSLVDMFRRIYRAENWRQTATLEEGRRLIAADRAAANR